MKTDSIFHRNEKKPVFTLMVNEKFHCTWVVGFMAINATFTNISVILWWSVLLMEETRVPEENNCPVTSKENWERVER
jgi:hypothetical protein